MWPLPVPVQSARDTYLTCISRISSPPLKELLAGLADVVADAEDLYMLTACVQELYTLDAADFTPADPGVRDEMIKVYTDRMGKQGAPGRPVYDALRQAASRCPLCGHRDVTTLDHYLPKTVYPLLCVTPANLVPACSECNKAKSATTSTIADDQTLHPYFDDVDQDPWLKAEVVQGAPPAVVFFVDPPQDWTPVLTARVRHHFAAFGLAGLYGVQAAAELREIAYELEGVSAAGGEDAVRAHLQRAAESRIRGGGKANHWRPVAYRALADSSWYCSGGFSFS